MNLKVSTVTHGAEQLSKEAAFLVIQTALQGTLQGAAWVLYGGSL